MRTQKRLRSTYAHTLVVGGRVLYTHTDAYTRTRAFSSSKVGFCAETCPSLPQAQPRRNMLDKRPCLPRPTSSRSLLIPCDYSDGDTTTTFCNHALKSSGPALCSPCKIVIGFEVESEKKLSVDVCESPRSVLESSSVLISQEKQQQTVARSPRSGLGSLLASQGGSGSKEKVGDGLGIAVNCPDNSKSHNQNVVNSPSKVAAWLAKTSDLDPMDANVCACQGQGLHVGLKEDELLDMDISPLRALGSCVHGIKEMESDVNNAATSKPFSVFLGGDGSMEHEQVHVNSGKDVGSLFADPHVCVHDKEHASEHTPPVNCVQLLKGEGCDPCQERFCCHLGLDVEDTTRQSIFYASSPPPCARSLARASSGFLKMCNFCGRSLRVGKDVFMYRGDQPFCSVECRYQKIVLDETKGRKAG